MKVSTFTLRQSTAIAVVGILGLHTANSHAALCEYVVQSEWGNGFVAAVRITNNTNTPINGWSVNWNYTDGTTRTGGWNANISGNNPFTASGVGWNDRINPGQSVEFGVQGNKGVANSPAQRPTVTGAVCGSAASTSSTSSVIAPRTSSSNSSVRSSIASISSNSSVLPSSSASSGISVSSSTRSSSSSVNWSLSSSSMSSSSSSLRPNTLPIASLEATITGSTVYVDARASRDTDGDALTYSIDFGDGTTIKYPNVWHTYLSAGDYSITLKVSDGRDTVTETRIINAQPTTGNQPPIAMLTAPRERSTIAAHATASFDPEGTPLTYEWDFGDGAFTGDARTRINNCAPGSTAVTVTVSDGELADTRQVSVPGGSCIYVFDLLPDPQFTATVEGNRVSVDGRNSRDATSLTWDFGDGSPRVTGVLASHTYATGGTYNIELNVGGPSLFSNRLSQSVIIDLPISNSSSSSSSGQTSMQSSSRSSTVSQQSSSIPSSSSSSSLASSSIRSNASSSVFDRNSYSARRAATAPVIDGTADAVWDIASWSPIDVFWLGTQPNPSAQDYSGRYKALWDEDYLYLLFDITDDRIFDGTRDALDRYWEDDTVELFIDENKNGGQHSYNTSAWAYHISTYGDVVDYTTSGPKLLNDHIDVRLVSVGDKHLWELRVRIYGEDYADWKTNTPLKLTTGKLMGFSASYIDNDGSQQRESMMGSVDTQGHKNNQGYLDASVFGSLKLVE